MVNWGGIVSELLSARGPLYLHRVRYSLRYLYS